MLGKGARIGVNEIFLKVEGSLAEEHRDKSWENRCKSKSGLKNVLNFNSPF